MCKNCEGAGVGNLTNGRLYYWSENLNLPLIYLAKLKRWFDYFMDLLLFGFGAWGFYSLFRYYSGATIFDLRILDIFYVRDKLLLSFWLSLAIDCFLFYRISEHRPSKQRIATPVVGNLFAEMPEVQALELKKIKTIDKVDVFHGFSLLALKKIEEAFYLAAKNKNEEVRSAHMLSVIVNDREVTSLLSRLNLDKKELLEKINHQLSKIATSTHNPRLSQELRWGFIKSYLAASSLGESKVRPIHLLLPLLGSDNMLKEIFYSFAVEEQDVVNAVTWFSVSVRMRERYRRFARLAHFKPSSHMNRAYTAQATPLLNAFSHDMTIAAKCGALDYCVSRTEEVSQIFSEIASGRRNILLVGEPGVGKYTVIGDIAQLMVEEDVPAIFSDKRLVELDISRLLAGADAANAQARLQAILDEVSVSGNIIIFINNIETIAGISAGNESSLDLADVLINHLEQTGLICFANATRENYAKFIEHKPLGQRFAKIDIKEPDFNRTIEMIESKIGYFENKFKVFFTYGALDQAVKLSNKYLHETYQPSKAIEVLENMAMATKGSRTGNVVERETAAEIISKMTGVPINKVGNKEREELLNLEERIHEHMIDQVEAVVAVSSALRRARAQLTQGKRPIASFLFLGSTGVGKTELAKAIASVYFGDEKCMTRLDMSEYQLQDSIGKMIGDGHGQKGYLTEAVRQRPFSLLLLDEFEKAHPDILNLFLQVMDDGRLTDGEGRTIDFTNSILIATSNAGAMYIQDAIRMNTPMETVRSTLVNEHLNKIMRPELINRFDGVIVFKPLGEVEVVEIARLLINKMAENLAEKGINLKLSESGLKLLAHEGYDPQFGARPMRRLLQDKVENKIAELILSGKLNRRDTVLINDDGAMSVEQATIL